MIDTFITKIYIIVPVHNRINTTRNFIRYLKRQTYTNYHLVLVDDNSTDGTAEMVSAEVKNLTIIKGNGKLWWAGALQKGYDWIKNSGANKEDIVLMINDDTEFGEDYFSQAIKIFQDKKLTNTKVLLYSPNHSMQSRALIDYAVKIDWSKFSFTPTLIDQEINCVSTRGLFVRVKDFISLGGFHPILLPHYLSDYEYTNRAYNKGYKLLPDKRISVYFDETSNSIENFDKINLKLFFKYYFSKKYTCNPIYFTSFILLTCPIEWIPLNLFKIYTTMLKDFVKAVLNSFRKK